MAKSYDDYLAAQGPSTYEDYQAGPQYPELAEATAASKQPVQHRYIPDQNKPPGTWNPLIHAGKQMMDLASGVRQLVGDNDNAFSRQVQEDAELYNEKDQPILAQIAGGALMMLPELAIAPGALPLTALPFAALTKPTAGLKGIAGLAKEIAAETAAKSRLALPPGVRGGAEGAAYGTASPVDVNTKTPGMDRLKNAGIGLAAGAGLDALVTNAKLATSIAQANNARKKISGDLPTPVRLPGPELWNQRPLAARAKTYRDSSSDTSWDPGQRTKRLYESGYGSALKDVESNVSSIRQQATGQAKPVQKGVSLNSMLDELQLGKEQSRTLADDKMTDFLKSDNNISVNAQEMYDVANEFADYLKYQVPGKEGERFNELRAITDKIYDKSNAGFINVKDIELLRREAKNIVKNTNPGSTAGQAASKLLKSISDKMDTINVGVGKGTNAFGSKDAADAFYSARDIRNNYNTTYNKNRIIREASNKELSANQLSDSLFGAKNMQDSSESLDAIDQLMAISPGYKKNLKRESLQQLFSGQSAKGKNFDIGEFIKEYGGALDTGRGKPIFDKLYSKDELGQLNDLYNVSRKLEMSQPDIGSSQYARTSVPAQAMTTNVAPTAGNLLNSPVLRKHVGRPVEDYLNAARYGTGRKGALSNSTMSGKVGATTANSMLQDTGAPKDEEESSLSRLLKLLGSVAF